MNTKINHSSRTTTDQNSVLERLLKYMPPAHLARTIGMSKQSMTKMRKRGVVPVGRCAQIEVATKGVFTREILRSDHFCKQLDYEMNPAEISRF